MKSIRATIETEVIIDGDDLENIKNDCYYAIDEAITDYLAKHLNLRFANIAVSTYNEIQKTIVESMYQDFNE